MLQAGAVKGLILLPHMLILFMTSLIQTAETQNGTLTVGVFATLKRGFSTNRTRNLRETVLVFVFGFFKFHCYG